MANWWESAPLAEGQQAPMDPNARARAGIAGADIDAQAWLDQANILERPYVPSALPWLDRPSALASNFVRQTPMIGEWLDDRVTEGDAWLNNITGFPEQTVEDRRQIKEAEIREFPTEAAVGGLAGEVLPLMLAPQALMGGAGSLATRVGVGALSGGGISFADALTDGDSLDEAARKGLTGAALGGGFPIALKAISGTWKGARNALAGNVSGGVDDAVSSVMKSLATDLFQKSDAAGVMIRKEAYDRFLSDLTQDIMRMRPNEALTPQALGVMEELAKASAQIGERGGMELGELHILRQIAQAGAQAGKGRDTMLNSMVIEKLDDFMSRLGADDIANAADPEEAVRSLQAGIENWHIARKTATIEEALYKAANSSSDYDTAVRTQFRNILNNARARQGFTSEELAQLERVANGTLPANMLRLVGRFGFSPKGGNALMGTIGALGGAALGDPTGGIASLLVTSGAKAGAQGLTRREAQQAINLVSRNSPHLTAQQEIMQILSNMNQAPVNFPVSPVAAALVAQ